MCNTFGVTKLIERVDFEPKPKHLCIVKLVQISNIIPLDLMGEKVVVYLDFVIKVAESMFIKPSRAALLQIDAKKF